jgi:tetratricopeptide (TPR) repeat protein
MTRRASGKKETIRMTRKRSCLLLLLCLILVSTLARGQETTLTIAPEILDVIKKSEECGKAEEFAEAQALLETALTRYRTEGRKELQIALAYVYFAQGQVAEKAYAYNEAIRFYEAAYVIDKEYRRREAAIDLNNLGIVSYNLTQYDKAVEYFKQSLVILREVNDRSEETTTLNNLGAVYSALGEREKALACSEQALVLLR